MTRLLLHEQHARWERLGRRGGDAERLTEHALRGCNQGRGQIAGALRQHDRIRGQRHAAFIDARRQLDAAAGSGLSRERAERDFAGLLRDERELRRGRLSGGDRVERDRLIRDELCPRDAAVVEVDRDEISGALRSVGDGGVEVVALAAPNRPRVRDRDRERRVAHEHGASRQAHQLHRSRWQAVEHRLNLEIEEVRALFQPFDQEFRLTGFLRPDRSDVVCCVS